MNRFHINDFAASGPIALFLLSAISALRGGPTVDAPGLEELVRELDEHTHSVPPPEGQAAPKKTIRFGDYFTSEKPSSSFKHAGSLAYLIFCSYIGDQLRRSAAGLGSDAAPRQDLENEPTKLVDRLIRQDRFGDVAKELAGWFPNVPPTLEWISANGKRMSVPALSENGLRLRLLGLSPNFKRAHPESGLFLVIREARGVFGRSSDRRNVLVRDLLWLRHGELNAGRKEIIDPTPLAAGYYFSSVEGGIYQISTLAAHQDGQIQLQGQLIGSSGDLEPHRFYLSTSHVALGQETQPARLGLIAGSTRDAKRPAAWKALIARPPDALNGGDQLELALELIAGQNSQRVDHAALTSGLDYLQAKKVIGVLASRHSNRDLKKLRGAFKRLVANREKPLIDEVTRELFTDLLKEKTRNLLAKALQDGASSKEISELLDGILASWANLEPVHLFIPTNLYSTRDDPRSVKRNRLVRERLQKLVEAEPVEPTLPVLMSKSARSN